MTDTLKLSINSTVPKSSLVSTVLMLGLVLFGSLFFSLDDNKKVTISCNKIENTCSFKLERFLSKTKEYTRSFDSLGDADMYVDGSSRGVRHYALEIPSSEGTLKLFTISNNKVYLSQIANDFNDAKNNLSVNNFVILPPEQIHMTLSVFCTLILLAVIFLLIFLCGYKEIITIDKAKDEIKIVLYRLVWSKSKIIKISQIADINLKQENYGSQVFIEYTLLNGKKYKLFYLLYPNMILTPIYSQVSQFIFNQNIENKEQATEKSWLDKYTSS